jgi:hypothetical protein
MSAQIWDQTVNGVTDRGLELIQMDVRRQMNINSQSHATTLRESTGNTRKLTLATPHTIEVGNYITVSGVGGTDYNSFETSPQRLYSYVSGVPSATEIEYSHSVSKSEGSTADTGGTVLRTAWNKLRIGMRALATGDANLGNIWRFGISSGETNYASGSIGQFLGLDMVDITYFAAAKNYYNTSNGDHDIIRKIGPTRTVAITTYVGSDHAFFGSDRTHALNFFLEVDKAAGSGKSSWHIRSEKLAGNVPIDSEADFQEHLVDDTLLTADFTTFVDWSAENGESAANAGPLDYWHLEWSETVESLEIYDMGYAIMN